MLSIIITMNWEEIDDTSRTRIQSFISAFDKFVKTNHPTSEHEDTIVQEQWEKFRIFIEAQPGITQNHNKYVLDLRRELLNK